VWLRWKPGHPVAQIPPQGPSLEGHAKQIKSSGKESDRETWTWPPASDRQPEPAAGKECTARKYSNPCVQTRTGRHVQGHGHACDLLRTEVTRRCPVVHTEELSLLAEMIS